MERKFEKLLILISTLAISLSTGAVQADLVALWEFDSCTGNDSYGDNHGMIRNGAIFSTNGRIGTHSLQLDGIDDHIVVASTSALNFTSTMTVAAWVNSKTWDKNARIMQKGIRDNQYRLTSEWDYMSFDLKNVGRLDTAPPPTDKWIHIIALYDGMHMCIYYDGELVASIPAQGLIAMTCDPLNIGTKKDIDAPVDDHFEGYLDDVAIFNHALSTEEIGYLYRHGAKSFINTGYKHKLIEKVESKIRELTPQQAVDFLQKTILEHEKKEMSEVGLQSKLLASDLYYLLARAKESAGAHTKDVINTYKRSITRILWQSYYGPASFLWLFENVQSSDYVDIVAGFARNTNILSYNIHYIVDYFKSSENWPAFKLFLDTAFSEVDDPAYYAVIVTKCLGKDKVWMNKFSKYCQSNPELTGYLFCKQEETARNYVANGNFKKAVETYRDIVKKCGPNQKKNVYEFKVCECLFKDHQYKKAIHELETFIKNNKATNRTLVSEAIMLKGQACLYIGDVERAINTFLLLAIEYPEVKQAAQANFFVGYYNMLQGLFGQATQAFNIVMKDYPESRYAVKARSSLMRIENMTK